MRLRSRLVIACVAGLALAASAQSPYSEVPAPGTPATPSAAIPIVLDWTPPQLALIGHTAEVKNSFVLDRSMLGAVSSLLPDSESATRQSIRKLDGVAVHLYRFHQEGQIDSDQVEQIREAYHARGWKHLVTQGNGSTPLHTGTTDLWLAVDGIDVRGGTVLVVTPKSLSLVTFSGNLNPIDLLRLRGHFGIPNFTGDSFHDAH